MEVGWCLCLNFIFYAFTIEMDLLAQIKSVNRIRCISCEVETMDLRRVINVYSKRILSIPAEVNLKPCISRKDFQTIQMKNDKLGGFSYRHPLAH